MVVTRSVNGVPISEEDLPKLVLTNPTIERVCQGVAARLRKQPDRVAH